MAENQKNRIRFDLTDNPELADVFLNKEIGGKCKLKIEFVVTEKTNEYVTGKVRTVVVPDVEYTEEEYNPATGENEKTVTKKTARIKPDVDAPISILFGDGY